MMKKLIYKLTVIMGCLFLYSGYANAAACVQNPNFKNIPINIPSRTYTIQYDDNSVKNLEQITMPFIRANTTTKAPNSTNCGNGRVYIEAKFTNGWNPSSNNFAATNIPGISIAIYTMGEYLNYSTRPEPANTNSINFLNGGNWVIFIRKTGSVTQGGTLNSGIVSRLNQINPGYPTWYLTYLNIPANAIRFNVVNCSLKNTVPVINLGEWYDTQFKNIGDKSTDVNVPITLTCKAGTNIKATVTSTSGYVNASQGQLALSGTTKATGIAIQLVDRNNVPIALNTKNTVQNNTANGDYIFGWKARYIKTANNITPGPANATATVNVRYE